MRDRKLVTGAAFMLMHSSNVPLSFCCGSVTGIYRSLVVCNWWRWIWQDRILFSRVCGPYILWECEEQEILNGEWRLTRLSAKHQVLEDSDEIPNIRFAWYRRYRFRKCRVHFWFGHDGCHDAPMEKRLVPCCRWHRPFLFPRCYSLVILVGLIGLLRRWYCLILFCCCAFLETS